MNCIGCNASIPAGKKSCPMCGAPIEMTLAHLPHQEKPGIVQTVVEHHHHHQYTQPDKPVLIEQTAKKWKKMRLFAFLLGFFALVSCIGASEDKSTGGMGFAMLLWAGSAVLYIRARFGAWWNHG